MLLFHVIPLNCSCPPSQRCAKCRSFVMPVHRTPVLFLRNVSSTYHLSTKVWGWFSTVTKTINIWHAMRTPSMECRWWKDNFVKQDGLKMKFNDDCLMIVFLQQTDPTWRQTSLSSSSLSKPRLCNHLSISLNLREPALLHIFLVNSSEGGFRLTGALQTIDCFLSIHISACQYTIP